MWIELAEIGVPGVIAFATALYAATQEERGRTGRVWRAVWVAYGLLIVAAGFLVFSR